MNTNPPIAHKKPLEITLHNETRCDEYAWLRDPNWQIVMQDPAQLDPGIREYLEAENEYTAAYMQDTEKLQDQLFIEMKQRIKEDDSTVPAKDGDYHYYSSYVTGAQHPRYCRYKNTNDQQEEILLDADKLANDYEYFSIGECEHSPNHRYLAYATDTKGSEFYTLKIIDLETGAYLQDCIENIQGNFVWAMDSQTIIYTTLDANHRPDKVFRHILGTTRSDDALLYQEMDAGFFVSLDRTESNRFIIISAHDHTTSEVHYLNANNPTEAILFEARESGIEYDISDHDQNWLIYTNADACEDYKIMSCPLKTTTRQHWQDFHVPAAGTLLRGIYLFKDFLVRSERCQGLPKIVVMPAYSNETDTAYAIDFAEQAYELGLLGGFEFDTNILRFSYTSMTTPTQVFDYDMQTQTRELRKQQEVPSGHDPHDFITERIFAQAEDGTKIPISILYQRDTPLDGNAPLLLYGYGSYGSTMPASFSTSRYSLVQRGFVYAIAHIRGGMELGYSWYTQGKLKNKKNSFNDFICCAKHLITQHFTSKGNITIHGGSAGGMLIGATLNLAPELFKAAVADVPFVDVLNTMCDASLPLTPPEWPEWGNPNTNVDDYENIQSYSPYENVAANSYPHLLVTAGLTDPRVTYWEPAKWVAKLRANKTDKNVLLLKTNMEAGHAGASGRFDSLKEVALMYAFILKAHNLA